MKNVFTIELAPNVCGWLRTLCAFMTIFGSYGSYFLSSTLA